MDTHAPIRDTILYMDGRVEEMLGQLELQLRRGYSMLMRLKGSELLAWATEHLRNPQSLRVMVSMDFENCPTNFGCSYRTKL